MSSSPTLTSDSSKRASTKGRLSDKVAVVTGASGGIGKNHVGCFGVYWRTNTILGRAICLAYASEGAKVVASDIKDVSNSPTEKDITTVDLIKKQGGHAFFVKTDVTNSESVDALIKEAVTRWGRVDM